MMTGPISFVKWQIWKNCSFLKIMPQFLHFQYGDKKNNTSKDSHRRGVFFAVTKCYQFFLSKFLLKRYPPERNLYNVEIQIKTLIFLSRLVLNVQITNINYKTKQICQEYYKYYILTLNIKKNMKLII